MPIEKIIVLEDDVIVRKNLEQKLRQYRYEVVCADTLAAAQELLAKENYDLMMLDVRLPDGEGIELLKHLQLRPQKPLVVVMTGFGSVESAVECMRNGAFDYLIKPFTDDQLEVTLRKAENFTQLVKDILLLADHFIRRLSRKHGAHVQRLSAQCQAYLLDHSWPGNVRELQNVIERAVILCNDEGELQLEHLGFTKNATAMPPQPVPPLSSSAPIESGLASPAALPTLSELEKHHIFAALDLCRGNRTRAAKMLDISIRTLRNKLNEYRQTGTPGLPAEEDEEEPAAGGLSPADKT